MGRGAHARTREVYELYIVPTFQGSVSASACSDPAVPASTSVGSGASSWALASTPAIDFYWRRGGPSVMRTFDRIGGAKLEKIAFTWD